MNGLIGFPLTIIILFMVVATAGGGADFAIYSGLDNKQQHDSKRHKQQHQYTGWDIHVCHQRNSGRNSRHDEHYYFRLINRHKGYGQRHIRHVGGNYSKRRILFRLMGAFQRFAQPLIAAIPIFGILIYLMLTVMYIIGFVQGLSGGPAND